VIEEAEARQLPAVIDEWWDAPDARRWLARALRIDLALLTERPELVVPCLHRRCAWPGDPAEAAFYAERPEVPPDAAALRELVAGWRPGRPWLRALRPPPIPLDGGVLEEYRTSQPGEVRFSDDAQTIAVVGDGGATAWERATGRRVAGARAHLPAAEAPARWRIGRDSGWGRLVLESDDHRLELAYGEEDFLDQGLRQLTDELVLVWGFDMHGLVDVRTARLLWISPGNVDDVKLSPDGGRLWRAGAGAVEVSRLATGEVLGAWPVPGVRGLAPASDGTVATSSPGVVRVWDPDLAARSRARLAATTGWTATQFSPDGTRLVTGGLLCDARTGAAIAAMDVNWPESWLMGGPPAGCQRLTDGGFVEIMPDYLRIWDARDGALVVDDPGRRGLSPDAVAFDARGARYAFVQDAGRRARGLGDPTLDQRLIVRALRSGELLLDAGVVHLARVDRGFGYGFALGFSPDGAQLWWETEDGERWVLPLVAPAAPRRLVEGEPAPCEPEPVTLEVVDGLLTAGGAAIPCDDERVVASPDGRTFAYRSSHYALEDA
jgi:hypothetical protein